MHDAVFSLISEKMKKYKLSCRKRGNEREDFRNRFRIRSNIWYKQMLWHITANGWS